MNKITKRIGIAALTLTAAVGAIAATAGNADADQKLRCRMKGTWVESNDDFEFDADYLAKEGPDYFAGKYVNPGQAEADIIGNAVNGTWTIILTYTDAGHKNMLKKLVGTGSKDRRTHELVVTGDYKTYLGASDIKKDGRFKLHGKCK
ncbi:MAG: hypothetical protein QM820_19155 [Minicystis sp.]